MFVYTCGNVALKTGLSTSLSGSEAPSKSRCVCVFLCFVSSWSLKMSAVFVVFPMERGTQQESDVGGNVAVVGRKIKVSKT